jgi:ankyrin repeat protein
MRRQTKERKTKPALRLTPPEGMKTKAYVYGVEKLNGYDAGKLFEACGLGDVAKAKAFLAKDPRLVNAQYWYQFPIHMAVYAGHAELVKLLLDRGADPGQSHYTYDSWDKLLRSAKQRGYQQIASLLQHTMRKRFGYSPDFELLQEAIVARDSRGISAALRREPKLAQASDALGNNALHWSVITRQLSLIKQFVELGTPIDAPRADGQTPVLLAANRAYDYWNRAALRKAHPSLRNTSVMIGSLLAQGANYTISVAAAVGDQERVEQLLKKDASLARRLDSARISPLSYAAREGYMHIVQLLLDRGAESNAPEALAPDGRALFEACQKNDLELAELLLKHGANPNAGLDSSGCCLTIGEVCHGARAKPLQRLLRRHGAYTPPYVMSVQELKRAIHGRRKVTHHEEFLGTVMAKRDVKLLKLYLKADPTVARRVPCGDYPKSLECVRLLLSRGLDPNRSDWLGRTFLHFCAANGDTSMASLFLKAGADINARDLEFKGTPLAAAVRSWGEARNPEQAKRKCRTVEFLLNRGAATNLPDDEPWATPLAWATGSGRGEIVSLLKQHGAR